MLDCMLLIDHGLLGLVPEDAIVYKHLHSFHQFWSKADPQGYRGLADKESVWQRACASLSLTGILLGTSLRRHGLSFVVFDSIELLEICGGAMAEVLKDGVRCLAVSTTFHVSLDRTRSILRFLRGAAPNSVILVGGQGLRSAHGHSDIFQKLPEADIFVLGDGDLVFGEVVSRLKSEQSLGGIPGVFYRTPLGMRGAGGVATVELEAAPVPDFSIAASPAFNPHLDPRPALESEYITVEEARGCRFKCRYCSFPVNNSYRRKSPSRIATELQAAADAGACAVFLCGSDIIGSAGDVEQICSLLRESRLGLFLSSYARLDVLGRNLRLVDMLRDAGWGWLFCGIESGDPEVLSLMGKHADIEKLPGAADYLRHQLGMQVLASFIVGYPGECSRSIENTKGLMNAAGFDSVVLEALVVFKDTPLYHMRSDFGLKMLDECGAWEHYTMDSYQVPGIIEDLICHLTWKTGSSIDGLQHMIPLYLSSGNQEQAGALIGLLQRIVAAGSLSAETRDAEWAAILPGLSRLASTIPAARVEAVSERIGRTRTPWWQAIV